MDVGVVVVVIVLVAVLALVVVSGLERGHDRGATRERRQNLGIDESARQMLLPVRVERGGRR